MKRLTILALLLSALLPAFGADLTGRDIIYDADLDITFTSLIDYNIGFTREPVSGTIKPDTDGFDAEDHNDDKLRIRFLPDATTGGYTTGDFNFYAQVFTTTPMRFYIKEATALTNGSVSVDYVNTSNETANFKGSGSGSVAIIEESSSGDLTKPRTYNRGLCLEVTGNDNINRIITSGSDLTAHITIMAEVVE